MPELRGEELHPSTVHVLEFFEYEHLPGHLQEISRPLSELAYTMAISLGQGPELTTGLRKLLEAKDCLVRQAVLDRKKEGQE